LDKKRGTDKTLLRVEDTGENNILQRHTIVYSIIKKNAKLKVIVVLCL